MTERKMTGLYVFLLLAWWGGWLALDMWRIEHLLTDADKWAGFRRDILWCAGVGGALFIFLNDGFQQKILCLRTVGMPGTDSAHLGRNRCREFFHSLGI